jgi:hypothetical protein
MILNWEMAFIILTLGIIDDTCTYYSVKWGGSQERELNKFVRKLWESFGQRTGSIISGLVTLFPLFLFILLWPANLHGYEVFWFLLGAYAIVIGRLHAHNLPKLYRERHEGEGP